MLGYDINNNHAVEDGDVIEQSATLMVDLIEQMETQFEARINGQQKHTSDWANKSQKHEAKNEREDDVHPILLIHKEDRSLMN